MRAELLGSHTHGTAANVDVHVWQRDGKYIARGRHQGHAFGQTLGDNEVKAGTKLRHMLVELDNGTFVRSSERGSQQLKLGAAPRFDVRELVNKFLTEKRKLVGEETMRNYRSRLDHLITFSENPENRRRWPLAANINREQAIEFRSWLCGAQVARNGHSSAERHTIAPSHIYNILDCTRSLLSWAKSPVNNFLPSWLENPYTQDIVGNRPAKSAIREQPYKLDERIQIVSVMDEWQLVSLSWRLVLPLRPEDISGLLVDDVDLQNLRFSFGPRFGGRDYNKGRQEFYCPFPEQLAPLMRECIAERAAGPVFRQRAIYLSNAKPKLCVISNEDVAQHIAAALQNAAPRQLQAPQDHKTIVRKCIRHMGGISEDTQRKELMSASNAAGLLNLPPTYQLRESVNTEMEAAGVSLLVQRFVTGHQTNDIQNRYVGLSPDDQMRKYFASIETLLNAIAGRAEELGLVCASAA